MGPLLEGYHETSRCSRDTYLGSFITKHTSMRSIKVFLFAALTVALVAAMGGGAGALDINLLVVARVRRFLMREVPLEQ